MNLRPLRRALLAFLLTAWAPAWAPAWAQQPANAATATAATVPAATPMPDPAALVADGRRRYTGQCARCHGLNLVTNGIGFDLRTFPRDDKARFVHSVRKGLRAMPAFDSNTTDADIEALWAYIGSVNGWTP